MKGRTDGVRTGYIEFTATGSRTGHEDGRLVYDYVNNLLYLTIPYRESIKGKNPFFRILYVYGDSGKTER